ncbi:MAG TPA: hypothetical protein VEO94_02715 [Candidatus Dormibacteraeota bacterium]|nr:hypothetical protein [Candidatus Dormibacteraeota bacterium]
MLRAGFAATLLLVLGCRTPGADPGLVDRVIIQGTGHFPMLEKTGELNRLLADAIADLVPARP